MSDPNCYSCNDGKTLSDGWKCGVCGRLNSQDEDYIMNEQSNTPPSAMHTRLWFAVYADQVREAGEALAIFEFQEMAIAFAKSNYQGKGWIIRAVTLGTGPRPLVDITE